MLIVDAQIHLWAADRPDRPWPPGGAQRAQKPYPVDKDMALAGMKEAGVDRAVIVPLSWEGERNDVALEAARLHPDRFAVMGRFPLERPDSLPLVDGWRHRPGMLGMRFTFNTAEQRPWLTDGTADWALAGRRARRDSDHDVGVRSAGSRRSHRRALPRAQGRHRPHGLAQRHEGP